MENKSRAIVDWALLQQKCSPRCPAELKVLEGRFEASSAYRFELVNGFLISIPMSAIIQVVKYPFWILIMPVF